MANKVDMHGKPSLARPRRHGVVLAADVGGTKTVLSLWRRAGKEWTMVSARTFDSRAFKSFNNLLASFQSKVDCRNKIDAAGLGLAGPVINGVCKITNLPWVIDRNEVAAQLALRADRVVMINDVEALARGIEFLKPADLATLNSGVKNEGAMAVIAAGTSLGEAGLFLGGHFPVATEGGHATFSPQTPVQVELLSYLMQFGPVDWGRVLSGPGLVEIYQFLALQGRQGTVRGATVEGGAATITSRALDEGEALSRRALDLFVELYGAEAGNLALKMMAIGGVYVGGGIAPKILKRLKADSTFMDAFIAKGGNNMPELLAGVPVHVILNEQACLPGAAEAAYCAVLASL